MEYTQNKEFGFEIVAEGQFIDQGYLIKTIVIWLDPWTVNEWMSSEILTCRECYETKEEWRDYKAKKAKKREELENKILQKFNFVKNDKNSACIVKNVSEIFTVVLMEQLEGGKEDE